MIGAVVKDCARAASATAKTTATAPATPIISPFVDISALRAAPSGSMLLSAKLPGPGSSLTARFGNPI
jgi:hypothetical protein